MQQSFRELDRCILFPRSRLAADCIEAKELDSRYEVDVIDLNYSQFSKLELFGFFAFTVSDQSKIRANSFVQLKPENLQLAIECALTARKQTKDMEMLKLIDKYVEKAKRSRKLNLPIWFNT